MKEAVTIFFFANNNHLSNVKTLQSIFRQDYPRINLIVCNDCTYGFQSERLLNNFEAGRGENIQYLYFQENPWKMGECGSQMPFWDRIDSEYYYVLHSGDQFCAPDALRMAVNTLRLDKSLAAVVTGVELWDDDFKKCQSTTTITKNPEAQGVFSASDQTQLRVHRIRDCMTIYRLGALKALTLSEQDRTRHLGKQALPALLEKGLRITVMQTSLCRYCKADIHDQPQAEPAKLGSDTLNNIRQLLEQREEQEKNRENLLFHDNAPEKKPPRRNPHLLLFKLSTVVKICGYAAVALLLSIAGALFMLLEQKVLNLLGMGFLALAAFSAVWTVAMLACNLYYKRNPQRLVSN